MHAGLWAGVKISRKAENRMIGYKRLNPCPRPQATGHDKYKYIYRMALQITSTYGVQSKDNLVPDYMRSYTVANLNVSCGWALRVRSKM